MSQFHEDYSEKTHKDGPSDRGFGVVFTGFFLLVGLWRLYKGKPYWMEALALSGIFLIPTLFRPQLLRPLNRIWYRFGLLLSRVMNPIMLGVIFFLLFVPVGLMLRLLGKDLLRLRWDASATGYWIPRVPPGPVAGSMGDQF